MEMKGYILLFLSVAEICLASQRINPARALKVQASSTATSCRCMNGGTCFPGSSSCDCPWLYTGKYCEICQCLNGGRCYNDYYGTRCLCSGPYMGDRCQYKEISICQATNPCKNGGSCVDRSHYGFECSCPSDFSGRLCENKIVTGRTVPEQDQVKQRVAREINENVKETKQLCEQNNLKARSIFSGESSSEEKWKSLHPVIKTVLMDVVANDDHEISSSTHARIKKTVAGNDLIEMSRIMSERSLWKKVPVARYRKRKQMMKKALKNPWSSLFENESC